MTFLNRLSYYLLGVGLGILVVLAIFKDRKLTSWTPKNQVLKQIKEFPLSLNHENRCVLHCLGIVPDSLKSILQRAEVNMKLDDSQERRKGIYDLTFEEGELGNVRIQFRGDTCFVLNMESSIPCHCP